MILYFLPITKQEEMLQKRSEKTVFSETNLSPQGLRPPDGGRGIAQIGDGGDDLASKNLKRLQG